MADFVLCDCLLQKAFFQDVFFGNLEKGKALRKKVVPQEGLGGRRGGLMVSALDSSDLGSSLTLRCVVRQDTLLSQCLS